MSLNGYTRADFSEGFEPRIAKVGRAVAPERVVEAHRTKVHKVRTASGKIQLVAENDKISKNPIDVSWLANAAETYEVSADINDYVIVALPIVTPNIPNRNMDCFPFHEMAYFNPILGRLTYQTFVGKPTHIDHVNQDPKRAKGVHFDATLARWDHNKRYWKISVLTGWDRSKDPELVKMILSGERSGYSMGALVDHTRCSVCGTVSSDQTKCQHFERVGKGGIFQGSLVYDCCHGVNFIETSSVADPADPFAVSDNILGR